MVTLTVVDEELLKTQRMARIFNGRMKLKSGMYSNYTTTD